SSWSWSRVAPAPTGPPTEPLSGSRSSQSWGSSSRSSLAASRSVGGILLSVTEKILEADDASVRDLQIVPSDSWPGFDQTMSSNEAFMMAAAAGGLVVAAFITSAAFCLLVRYLAPRIGFVDRPGGHKGHRQPTPLGGGVAIWLTTVGILAIGVLVIHGWG